MKTGMRQSGGALAGLLLLVLAMGCRADSSPDSGSPEIREVSTVADTVRVLIYNIKHGLGMDGQVDLSRSARLIRELAPDIVLLQEIDSSTARTDGVNQAQTLAQLAGMPYYALSPISGRDC